MTVMEEAPPALDLDTIFASVNWQPAPIMPEVFWSSAIDTAQHKPVLYRGIKLYMNKEEFEVFRTDPDAFVRAYVKLDRLGVHWSDGTRYPRRFANWESPQCLCADCNGMSADQFRNRDNIKYKLNDLKMDRYQTAWHNVAKCQGCEACIAKKKALLNGCECYECNLPGNVPWYCNKCKRGNDPCWDLMQATDDEIDEAMEHPDSVVSISVAVVLHGEVDLDSVLDRDTPEFDDYASRFAIYEYSAEEEVAVRQQSKVRIVRVEFRTRHVEESYNVNVEGVV